MALFICHVNSINFNMLNDTAYLIPLNDSNIYRHIMSDAPPPYPGNQTKGPGNTNVYQFNFY